jgi:putative aldouronate transport system permease protein
VFPLIYELLLSFASQKDYLNAKYLIFPRDFNIESYKYILFQDRVGKAFLISVFVTGVGTLYTMTLNSLGAYVLTKSKLPGRKAFFIFILITMFFDGGLIPFYLTVKDLGMNNSLAALIIPFGVSTFDMILLRNFFAQVPEEMIESCKIDGANEFKIFIFFVIPLSTAGLATIGMFTIVAKWNDWYWPLIFLTLNDDSFPLALELRNVLMDQQGAGSVHGQVDMTKVFSQAQNAAMIIISVFPIMCIYPFLQKFFVKGIMLGSIKS